MSEDKSTGKFWIAVNAHPNRELVAAHHLCNQNYETYVPVLRKQIRHARRVQDVLRPLFPGYLFVRLAPSELRWRPILSTVGVRSVVCIGDTPCSVPDQLIDQLREREQNGVIVRAASPSAVTSRDPARRRRYRGECDNEDRSFNQSPPSRMRYLS